MIVAIHADDSGTPAALSMTAGTHARPSDRGRAQMLDRCAGDAYQAGNYGQALRLLGLARAADPSQAPQAGRAPGPRVGRQAGRRARRPPAGRGRGGPPGRGGDHAG